MQEVVAEGRDTGSVVFPFAAVRVFLVADAEARARRREAQLEAVGMPRGIDEIRENIRSRDAMDSGRAASPLVRPAGAFDVDTSNLTIEEQVRLIENEVRLGSAIRAIHHWSANGMIVMCIAHMLRVFIMGAYKKPRELNWVSGVLLLILTLAFGFTVYLLPWDQRAFWATTVGTEIDPEGDHLYYLFDFEGDGRFDAGATTGANCRKSFTYGVGTWKPELCAHDRDATGTPLHDDQCKTIVVTVTP